MIGLRKVTLADWRQTLALCIVWGALAGSASLCLLAPVCPQDMEQGRSEPRIGAIMISLASKAF